MSISIISGPMGNKLKYYALAIGFLLVLCILPSVIMAESVKNDIDSQDDDPMENERAVALGLFGKLRLTDGVATGRFVSFSVDMTNGNISDYALRSNVDMIDLIEYFAIEDLTLENNDIKVTGSLLKIGKDPINLKLHDNPTGMIQVQNDGIETKATLLMTYGLGIEVLTNDDDSTTILVQSPGIRGIVHLDNGIIVVDNTNYGTYLNITMSAVDHLIVRFQPMIGERNGAIEQVVLEGIMNDVVAAEISVSTDNEGVDYEDISYDPDTNIKVGDDNDGEIVIEVTSETQQGRVLLINIDKKALNGAGEIDVVLDGSKVSSSNSPEDVMDAAASSSEESLFYSIETDGLDQIIVYVPSFSTHHIVVSSNLPNEVSYGVFEWGLALFGAMVILALAGYMVVRRY